MLTPLGADHGRVEVHLGEDNLTALGATIASSGATALYHVIGVTPEVPTIDTAFDGILTVRKVDITMDKKKRIKLYSSAYFPINSRKTLHGIGLRRRYSQIRDSLGQAY